MKLTKYEHACLDLEDQGKRLIVDPGIFTKSLTDFSNICAVIVTHIHPDHFDLDLIDKIRNHNPEMLVYTVAEVALKLGDRPHETVSAGSSELCGIFHVSFFGGEHAVIRPSRERQQNVGILINEKLYYPGDSFVQPGMPVQTLAVPAVAPWMKASEAMDFIAALKSDHVFPTHNALLSEEGAGIYDALLASAAEQAGSTYSPLPVGGTLEL